MATTITPEAINQRAEEVDRVHARVVARFTRPEPRRGSATNRSTGRTSTSASGRTREMWRRTASWLDQMNGVGLFEPVRTEDAWQRRSLGRALLTEGIRRFMSNGTGLIKVSRMPNSDAARGLDTSVGFQDAFGKLRYVRT